MDDGNGPVVLLFGLGIVGITSDLKRRVSFHGSVGFLLFWFLKILEDWTS